jgi:Ni/Co efflux regulator RcnB
MDLSPGWLGELLKERLQMKKILSVMLGMSFVLGTLAFAQDTQSTDKMSTTTKTKKHKNKKNKKNKSGDTTTTDTTTAPK